jgi:hypothetical protein
VPRWLLFGLLAVVWLYAVAVLALVALGRRSDARALAGFIPDCLVLVRRLLADPQSRAVAKPYSRSSWATSRFPSISFRTSSLWPDNSMTPSPSPTSFGPSFGREASPCSANIGPDPTPHVNWSAVSPSVGVASGQARFASCPSRTRASLTRPSDNRGIPAATKVMAQIAYSASPTASRASAWVA